MPIYEYQCSRCGLFEVTQRVSEPVLKRCPKCSTKVTKLISNTSFQLKGSGWYVTDYARKDGRKEAHSKGEEGTTSKETKKETKSDASTKEKTDSKASEASAA
jgi:putative FmdB family regulatory protein